MSGNFQNAANERRTPQPLVSIIINNYNYARFLSDAIDSAINQTYENTEVIVVDDGSTDNSKEIIERYGEKITAVYQTNSGQAAAMNRGCEISKGELVYFLDSDDVALPETVEKIVNNYSESTIDEALTLQFKLEIIDSDGKLTGGIAPDLEKLQGAEAVRLLESKGSYVHPPTSGNVFSRRFLAKVMPIPEEEYRISADLYLCTLAPLAGTVIDIEEALAQYRIHGANHCATMLNFKDSLPVEHYVEMCRDESSARRRQKKICAAYLRRPIGGNTDLLYLIWDSTTRKLSATGKNNFRLAKDFLSRLRADRSLVPLRNKIGAFFYLTMIAFLPASLVRSLVRIVFVRPPEFFGTILKKSFGR